MNDDFEKQLHDMLQERGSRPMGAPQAPPKVLRRARRRQLSTALVSGATAVAVIGGAILGAQAISGNRPQKDLAEHAANGSTRTVQVYGYGVTYPYDWALQTVDRTIFPADPGPEQPASSDDSTDEDPAGTAPLFAVFGPYLQLSNQYPDHLLDLACGSTDLPANGVALQVNASPEDAGGENGLTPVEACADGSTFYAGLVPTDGSDAGVVFMAHAKVGADASETDRQALFDAFDSIEPPSGDTGVKVGGGGFVSGTTRAAAESGNANEATPAPLPEPAPEAVSTVVAGGTTASGADWVFMVDHNMQGGSVSIGGMGVSWGWAWAESPDGEQPPQQSMPDFDGSVSFFDADGTPIAFGSVIDTATSVQVRPSDGDAIDIDLLPAPAVTGIDRSYFLQELPDLPSDTGTIVALDSQGGVIGEQDYDVSQNNVSPGDPGCTKPMPAEDDGQTDTSCAILPPDCPVPEEPPDGSSSEDTICTVPPVCPATAEETNECSIPPCPTDPGQPAGAEEPTDPTGFIGCLPPPVCPDTPVSSDDPPDGGGGTTKDDCTIIVPPTCDFVPGDAGDSGDGSDPDDPTTTGTEQGDSSGGGEDPNGPIACSVGGGSSGSGGSSEPSPGDGVEPADTAAGEGAASAGVIAVAPSPASGSKS